MRVAQTLHWQLIVGDLSQIYETLDRLARLACVVTGMAAAKAKLQLAGQLALLSVLRCRLCVVYNF